METQLFIILIADMLSSRPSCEYLILRRTAGRYFAWLTAVTSARNSASVLGVAVVDWVLEQSEMTLCKPQSPEAIFCVNIRSAMFCTHLSQK